MSCFAKEKSNLYYFCKLLFTRDIFHLNFKVGLKVKE